MDDTVHYLTAESLATLKKEYETLRATTIPDIAKRIDEAKQQGDLSENAEYTQAREDMAWAQGRLQELQQIVSNAQIIVNKKTGVVSLGNTIKVKANGQIKEYTIVGPQEINPAAGFISHESPLGEAFLGHSPGEIITVTVPSGTIKYEIISIE